jgi:hypothetical protein
MSMKKYLHWWVTLLFLLAFAYDAIVWSAATRIPDVGEKLQRSIRREALLANVYIAAGTPLVAFVPALDAWGENYFQAAVSEGFPRIQDDPAVAMDLIFSENWNARHRTLKTMYWVPPVLAVLAIVLWIRRPKKISLMGRR